VSVNACIFGEPYQIAGPPAQGQRSMRLPYIFSSISGDGPGKPGRITSRSSKRIIRYAMPAARDDNSRVRIHSKPIGSRSMPGPERADLSDLLTIAVGQAVRFFCLRQTWQSRERRDYALLPILEDSVLLATGTARDRSWDRPRRAVGAARHQRDHGRPSAAGWMPQPVIHLRRDRGRPRCCGELRLRAAVCRPG
jgi:hypothetical protein